MRLSLRFAHWISASITAVVLSVSALAAAPAGSSSLEGATQLNASIDPIESSRLLGPVYKMEAEGFKLAPPAGSRVIERRGVDLVSFVVDNKSWGGSLQLVTLPKVAMGLEEFVKNNNGELNKMFKGVQVLQEKYQQVSNKPAVRLDISMEGQLGGALNPGMAQQLNVKVDPNGGVVALYRQQLILQVNPDENGMAMKFLMLTMYAPLKDRADATQTFAAMLGQFELFDSAALKKRRLESIVAAKAWLAEQSAEKLRAAIVRQPQLFRIVVGGKDLGYLRFDELVQLPNNGIMVDIERDKFKGVLEQVNYRTFPEDGSVIYGQNEAFWAYSKTANGSSRPGYSTWSNIRKVKTFVAPPVNQVRPGQPVLQEKIVWVQETGIVSEIGKSNQMVVALSGDASQRLPEGINRVIPVEAASPLPKILDYSWTRFVNLSKPSELTFTTYDSGSQKLALRNLIVTGQKESILIDGKTASYYKCIDEIDPGSTTIWVDNAGLIKMMRTSDQSVMLPTTEEFLRTKWGAKLKDQ